MSAKRTGPWLFGDKYYRETGGAHETSMDSSGLMAGSHLVVRMRRAACVAKSVKLGIGVHCETSGRCEPNICRTHVPNVQHVCPWSMWPRRSKSRRADIINQRVNRSRQRLTSCTLSRGKYHFN